VNDVVGRSQRMQRVQGQKPGVAGTRTCKPDFARRKVREIGETIGEQLHREIVLGFAAPEWSRM
jgi:hypothetical protein